MENSNPIASPPAERPRWIKYLILVALLLSLVIVFFVYQAWSTRSALPSSQLLSQADFEELHGLQVRLIGVTGGGGLVDFRLKMTDAESARQFLQHPENLPVLLITADGTQILAADIMDDDIQWDDGGILFMLLPNSDGAVKPGSPITIKFGDLQLEPVLAQ